MADFQSRVNEWNVELFELSKTMAKNEFPLHVIDWACSKFSPESIFQTTAFGATGRITFAFYSTLLSIVFLNIRQVIHQSESYNLYI